MRYEVYDLPMAKFLTGIDVSEYQGNIKWEKCSELDFAYIRSNVGLTVDTKVKRNTRLCPIPFGLYVYVKPELDVVAQMRILLDNHKKFGVTLIPQLDFEHDGGKSPKELKDVVRVCIQMVSDTLGALPTIYTYPSFWNSHIDLRKGVADCPLWVARYVRYSDAEFKTNPVPKPEQWGKYARSARKPPAKVNGWDTWDVWQFAGNYDNAGKRFGMESAHLDLNIMKEASFPRFVL